MQKFVRFASLLLLSHLFSSLIVDVAGNDETSVHFPGGENPYSPKAFLMRYWSKKISNNFPKSSFLLSKASPLSAVDSAAFTKLAAENSLSNRLPEFCSAAKLLCFPDLTPSLERHSKDVNFAVYDNRNFTNYGRERVDGTDSFQTYSPDGFPVGTFQQYSRSSTNHNDEFTTYDQGSNVVDQSFNSYGTGANGGAGKFTTYANDANVPNLGFKSYSRGTNGRTQSFTSYSDDGNAGDQLFANYGKEGNGALNEFTSYGDNSNVVGSTFSGYGKGGNSVNNTFTNYGNNQNVPLNTFNNYGRDGNAAVENFANYRDQANVGDDSFKSYAKNSNGAEVDFTNYGNSSNEGTDKFSGYGKDANDPTVNFKIYGINNTFKDYAKSGVTFSGLPNASSKASSIMEAGGGSLVKRWVEPGKFFREAMLKEGTTMPLPDIKDKMPKRSFLPRSILSKLPFSSSRMSELKKTFHAGNDSAMERMIKAALEECERKPSAGETKRCVGSVEDMIDFATSVLGQNVVVRTTENVKGSNQQIMIGSINRINGGKITQSVSCHQSLYPYLLYYCHSVPKVRVYEADLLDPNTKAKINHGVAICHVDTSAWSATHGAFMALGSGPGRIEVCHWIFENDMTWTIADSLQ